MLSAVLGPQLGGEPCKILYHNVPHTKYSDTFDAKANLFYKNTTSEQIKQLKSNNDLGTKYTDCYYDVISSDDNSINSGISESIKIKMTGADGAAFPGTADTNYTLKKIDIHNAFGINSYNDRKIVSNKKDIVHNLHFHQLQCV